MSQTAYLFMLVRFCLVNSRNVYHPSTYNEMRLVPGLAGAFSNSLASRGVKVKCTIFSGSSSTPSVADAPPERKLSSCWNIFYSQRFSLSRAPGYNEISLPQKSMVAMLTCVVTTGTFLQETISFLSLYSLLGFVYIGVKAKAKATSLPDGFIENPITWCWHWAMTKIKEKIRVRSLQTNL